MARIRTIKPEFPHSESMGRVCRDARLCFIQMWTLADDAGRLRGNSRMLASLLFPYDDDAKKLIDGWMSELEGEDCIVRYAVEGTSYVQICNWLSHQKIDKPSPSKLPPFDETSRTVANPRECSSGDRDQYLDQEGKGREGTILVASNRDDRALTVFVHWQREWKHPGTRLDKKRRARIEARLKDFTAEQLCEAVSGFRHSSWHTGTDPKGQGVVYDSIDCLLRDSGQVERGIGLFANPPRAPPKAETAGDRLLRNLNGDDNSRVIEHDAEYAAITRR